MERGNTIYIVTSRIGSKFGMYEIQQFLKQHNLKAEGIYFTDGELKVKTLLELGSHIHYDDDPEELKAAKEAGIEAVNTFTQEARSAYDRWFESL